jgi:hypothetical protein
MIISSTNIWKRAAAPQLSDRQRRVLLLKSIIVDRGRGFSHASESDRVGFLYLHLHDRVVPSGSISSILRNFMSQKTSFMWIGADNQVYDPDKE